MHYKYSLLLSIAHTSYCVSGNVIACDCVEFLLPSPTVGCFKNIKYPCALRISDEEA